MVIFFWIVDLLIPAVMITFGLICKFRPPKNINSLYGYRTARSMKSQKTWDYAHARIGVLWQYIGIALFVIIIISKLFTPIEKEYLSLIHTGIGVIALIIGIPFIEKELGARFDENGDDNIPGGDR